jgi:hypothetical protein
MWEEKSVSLGTQGGNSILRDKDRKKGRGMLRREEAIGARPRTTRAGERGREDTNSVQSTK